MPFTTSLSSFVAQLPVATSCMDAKGRFVALNQAIADINGVSVEETIGKHYRDVLPDLAPSLDLVFDTVMQKRQTIERVLVEGKTPKSNETRYWLVTYRSFDLEGENDGLMACVEEIQDSLFSEKMKSESLGLLSKVINNLFTFVGVLEPSGVLIDANKAPLEAAGISINDVRGLPFWECYWWNYDPDLQAKLQNACKDVANGNVVRFDADVRAKDGFLSIDFTMKPLMNDNGQVEYLIPSAIDITEKKHAEKALSISNRRFEAVANRTSDGLLLVEHKTKNICLFNRGFLLMAESTESPIGTNLHEFFVEEDKLVECLSELNRLIEGKSIDELASLDDEFSGVFTFKNSLKKADVDFSIFIDSNQVCYLLTLSDVTDIIESQDALEHALDEKTILLNEVHHRVKNNLQVMSSLINLQASSVDKSSQIVLSDTQRRLRSMALIHELLYEYEDFSKLALQTFIHSLLKLLQDSMSDYKVKVTTSLDESPINISINKMLPFGLLVTELVTNAYKHAFTESMTNPNVHVSMLIDNEQVKLTIKDNGRGLSKESVDCQSLGTELINIFVKQLKASITTSNNNGCQHEIKLNPQ